MSLPGDASEENVRVVMNAGKNAASRPVEGGGRLFLSGLLVGGACVFGNELGMSLRFPEAGNAVFFLPYAVLTAALLVTQPRHWWIYLLASFGAHLTNLQRFPLSWVLVADVANLTKALLAVGGIKYFRGGVPGFDSIRSLIIFLVFAVLVAPATGACIGAANVLFHHASTEYWTPWKTWFSSNALTGLTFVPGLLFAITRGRSWIRAASTASLAEALLLAGALISVCVVVFSLPASAFTSAPVGIYAPLPFLLWAVVRFGSGGASLSLLAVSLFSILGAVEGRGPFSANSTPINILSTQLFLIVMSIPVLFIAVVIEERREKTNVLRESEERFRTVADAAPVMIWMSGTDKLCNFFNKGWLDFTGRTASQEFGNGWAEGVHREDLKHCLEVYGKAFDAREPFTMEYRLRRKDGEYRWVLDSGTPRFDAAGAFIGYIGSCIDIADRKQAELDHQLQTTELARVGRLTLMGELAASLAHEVNNPLGAMVTNASAGQRMISKGEMRTVDLQELFADIVADGHRAREVIQGIRNMARKSKASRSLVGVNDVIRDLIRIVRADAMARRVNLVVEVDANAGVVMGDRVQLLQVLLNLTMNAFEALSVMRADERRVVIRADRVNDGQICVSVRDRGPGFPAGLVDQLFEPFFSTKAEGTGMGLAIARSIIEAHGGTLSGENCDDRGACFTVRLPEVKEDKSKTVCPVPEDLPSGKK